MFLGTPRFCSKSTLVGSLPRTKFFPVIPRLLSESKIKLLVTFVRTAQIPLLSCNFTSTTLMLFLSFFVVDGVVLIQCPLHGCKTDYSGTSPGIVYSLKVVAHVK